MIILSCLFDSCLSLVYSPLQETALFLLCIYRGGLHKLVFKGSSENANT